MTVNGFHTTFAGTENLRRIQEWYIYRNRKLNYVFSNYVGNTVKIYTTEYGIAKVIISIYLNYYCTSYVRTERLYNCWRDSDSDDSDDSNDNVSNGVGVNDECAHFLFFQLDSVHICLITFITQSKFSYNELL